MRDTSIEIGRRIKTARKAAKMSQTELANRINKTLRTVQKYESGEIAPSIDMIEQIANKVGIAFQIEDDILDVVSTSEEIGKPAGSDEKNGKNTYVLFKGIEQSKKDAEQYTREALQIFDELEYKNPFLRELLLYLVGRKN